MIRVTTDGVLPVVYPIDTSWSTPAYTGTVQWNGVSKCLEVSTGTGWQRIDSTITLSSNPEVERILFWAKAKMQEEKELAELADSNVTIKDLLTTLKDTEEKIKIVKALIKAEIKPDAVAK